MKASRSPVNTALITMPTKINRIGSSPDFHDNAKTRKQASAPPINANSGVKKNSVGTNVIMNIDIKPAQMQIPQMQKLQTAHSFH